MTRLNDSTRKTFPAVPCADCGVLTYEGRCPSCAGKARYVALRAAMTPPNPSGLCMCGCGQPTPIAKQSNAKKGRVMGLPVRYVPGHQSAKNPVSLVDYIVDPETNCWLWQRATDPSGYPVASLDGRKIGAHRLFYIRFIGPIPEGMDVDHVWDRGCRHVNCVNPDHLEAVTRRENCHRRKRNRLTMDQAREIRALWATGQHMQKDIALWYNIPRGTVSLIVNDHIYQE